MTVIPLASVKRQTQITNGTERRIDSLREAASWTPATAGTIEPASPHRAQCPPASHPEELPVCSVTARRANLGNYAFA